MNYLIVLFKNKERKKIIKKFVTQDKAWESYNKLINDNNKIPYHKVFENGNPCLYELALLEKNSLDFQNYFKKDNLGRQIKVDLDDNDYKIVSIENFKREEKIYDIQKKKKITLKKFIGDYLPISNIKLISKINNKIVVQNDEIINLFSLKSEDDSLRFLNVLEDRMYNNNRTDCIIVPDSSKEQKKYLYNLLEKKGINKSCLYRRFTTFSK
jgi:hypothetical protein